MREEKRVLEYRSAARREDGEEKVHWRAVVAGAVCLGWCLLVWCEISGLSRWDGSSNTEGGIVCGLVSFGICLFLYGLVVALQVSSADMRRGDAWYAAGPAILLLIALIERVFHFGG